MELPIALITVRLFLRFLLGLILLSVGMSKLAHPRRFQQGIQDYQLLPPLLESRLALSTAFSFAIPVVELLAGLGLLSGLLLVPALMVTLCLFVLFSGAILINLIRGRVDLSCHCGGIIGDHHISWWLIGRNAFFMVGLLTLLFTPPDLFTVDTLVHQSTVLSGSLWSLVLPVVLLVGAMVAVVALINSARVLWRS
ncbi:MAG: MauE/DoxX family redox-associated membrane protein [Ktedonobacteraceae bacterium]